MFSGKMDVFGQKWLYLGKCGCNMEKVYSDKVVVFGQIWL